MHSKYGLPTLLLITLPAAMAAHAQTPGYYASLSYSQARFDERNNHDSPDDDDFDLINVGAGFAFSPFIAMEVRYGVTLNDNHDTPYGNEGLDRFYSAYLIPSYPLNDYFSAYALLGGTAIEVTGPDKDTDANFSYGAGLRMAFANNSEFFLEYSDHGQTPYSDISAVTFGVNYHF